MRQVSHGDGNDSHDFTVNACVARLGLHHVQRTSSSCSASVKLPSGCQDLLHELRNTALNIVQCIRIIRALGACRAIVFEIAAAFDIDKILFKRPPSLWKVSSPDPKRYCTW